MDSLRFSPSEATELAEHFAALDSKVPLREIRTEAEYDSAVETLNALLDAGGADEDHALAPLVAALGRFIGDYDDRHDGPVSSGTH